MARGAIGEVERSGRPGLGLRSTALNLLLLGISGLVALALAELSLRLFPALLGEEAALRVHWAEVAGDTDSRGQELMVDDREVGFLYRPGLEGRIARGDLDFSFRLDGRGFRNPEPWPTPARAVLLGDSMAFGYGAPDGQDWPTRLRERLPGLGLVNLGLIGSGTLQHERIYGRFAAPLQPPLTLLALFAGNDLDDDRAFARWLEQGARGSYRRFRGQGDRWLDGGVVGLVQRTHLFWFATELARGLANRSRGRTLELADGTRLQLVLPRPDAYTSADLDRTVAAVARLRRKVEAGGGRLLVLLMPTKEEVYLPLLGESAASPSAAVGARLAEQGLTTLDLGEALRARATRDGRPLYFAIDGHPNSAGQAIIAEAVETWLLGLVPELVRSGPLAAIR